jgi:hypothetical protein
VGGVRGAAAAVPDRRRPAHPVGYPTNDDLVIDGDGTPHLKRHRREDPRASSLKLEAQIKARLPERSLLGILARTAYWIEWWRRFGPASGSDPKIKDPFGRYVLATFVYGINMSAADAARHIAGTSARDLALVANRHVTVDKLNEAITDVVNAYARLDLIKAWGDGSSVRCGRLVDWWPPAGEHSSRLGLGAP